MSKTTKQYRYSLAPEDRKIAGVAATAGRKWGIDPTILRVAFLFVFLVIEWELAVGAYIALGLFFTVQKANGLGSSDRPEREAVAKRGSVHDLRTKLDSRDRRMMAIDHHLSSHDSDKLAREIEELRAKVDAKKGRPQDAPEASKGDA